MEWGNEDEILYWDEVGKRSDLGSDQHAVTMIHDTYAERKTRKKSWSSLGFAESRKQGMSAQKTGSTLASSPGRTRVDTAI